MKRHRGPFQGKTIEERLTVHRPTLWELAKRMGLDYGTPQITLTDYPRTHNKGRYVGVTAKGNHRISIARSLPVGEADLVLCHELTHALQCQRFDRDPKAFAGQWVKEMREAGITMKAIRSGAYSYDAYKSTPLEREAWEGAHRWYPVCESLGFVIRWRER